MFLVIIIFFRAMLQRKCSSLESISCMLGLLPFLKEYECQHFMKCSKYLYSMIRVYWHSQRQWKTSELQYVLNSSYVHNYESNMCGDQQDLTRFPNLVNIRLVACFQGKLSPLEVIINECHRCRKTNNQRRNLYENIRIHGSQITKLELPNTFCMTNMFMILAKSLTSINITIPAYLKHYVLPPNVVTAKIQLEGKQTTEFPETLRSLYIISLVSNSFNHFPSMLTSLKIIAFDESSVIKIKCNLPITLIKLTLLCNLHKLPILPQKLQSLYVFALEKTTLLPQSLTNLKVTSIKIDELNILNNITKLKCYNFENRLSEFTTLQHLILTNVYGSLALDVLKNLTSLVCTTNNPLFIDQSTFPMNLKHLELMTTTRNEYEYKTYPLRLKTNQFPSLTFLQLESGIEYVIFELPKTLLRLTILRLGSFASTICFPPFLEEMELNLYHIKNFALPRLHKLRVQKTLIPYLLFQEVSYLEIIYDNTENIDPILQRLVQKISVIVKLIKH